MPIEARVTITANISVVAVWLFSTRIRYPRPSEAPTHSAKTAPITESAAATFSPENRNGSAAGNWALRKRCHLFAFRVLSRLSSSGSAARRPSIVLTAIGKKLTSTITMTFGCMSKPNQMIRSGAIAGIGTICETTSHG